MKILHFTPAGGFYGRERVVYSLVKGLSDLGVANIIVTTKTLASIYSSLIKDVKVYSLPPNPDINRLTSKFLYQFHKALTLWRIIALEKPDVIHLHLYDPSFILLLPILLKIPCIMTEHGGCLLIHKNGVEMKRAESVIMFFVAHVLLLLVRRVISYMRRDREVCRLLRMRCHDVIYNCIDPEWWTWSMSENNNLKKSSNLLKIVFPARLSWLKGQWLLLRAIAKIRNAFPFKIMLVGDGPAKKFYELLAEQLNLSDITEFSGYVDGKEKFQIYKSADILVVNLTNPGLSQTLLEATAIGKPTITFYDPEVYDIFGEKLWYVQSISPEEVCKSIVEIVSNYESAVEKAKMAKKLALKLFDPKSFASKYMRVYEIVLSC